MDSAHDWAGIDHVPVTIVTRALADQLFPGQDPLGKTIYPGKSPVRIVGVVDHLARPHTYDGVENDYATLFPLLPDGNDVTYVLRTSRARSRSRFERSQPGAEPSRRQPHTSASADIQPIARRLLSTAVAR
jgi:hypothetical protein